MTIVMALVLALIAAVGVACWLAVWVAASPARLAVAGLPVAAAHPPAAIAVLAVVIAAGLVVVWRELAGSGWLVIGHTGPDRAPAGVS